MIWKSYPNRKAHGCNTSMEWEETVENFFEVADHVNPFAFLVRKGINIKALPEHTIFQLEAGKDFNCLTEEDVIYIINSSEIAAENRLKTRIASVF